MDAATIRANSKKDAEHRRRLKGPIYVPLNPSLSFKDAMQEYTASNSDLLGPIYVPEWGTDEAAAEVYCKHETVKDWEESKYTENAERTVLTGIYDAEGTRIFSSYDKDDLELFQSEMITRIANDIARLRVRPDSEGTEAKFTVYFKSPTVAQSREFVQCITDPERGISETLISRFLDSTGNAMLTGVDVDEIRQFDKSIVVEILNEMALYPDTPNHSNEVSRMDEEELGNSSVATG